MAKKILQINSGVGFGSTGKIVESIGQTAIANGFESHIAYGRVAFDSASNLYRVGTKYDVYRHFIKSRIFDSHGLGSKSATANLIKEIIEINPDILHLHNIHGYYLNYPLLFSFLSRLGRPIVWTLHDCWAFTGHCAHFSSIGCNKWQSGCADCSARKRYPKSFLSQSSRNYILRRRWFSENMPDNMTIVTVSQWLGDMAKKSFLSSKNIVTIENGVDTEIFHPYDDVIKFEIKNKYGLGRPKLLIGLATAWSENKGLSKYIKLVEHLPGDCDLLLVGLNDSQAAHMPDRIKTLRRTDNQIELAKLYSAADIVLNLSVEETFGLTTVEGFACGTPSIVLNTTSSPELITDATGLVVKHDSIQGIVDAIKEILSREKMYYEQACRTRAIENYDKNIQFQKYITLYNKLLERMN